MDKKQNVPVHYDYETPTGLFCKVCGLSDPPCVTVVHPISPEQILESIAEGDVICCDCAE